MSTERVTVLHPPGAFELSAEEIGLTEEGEYELWQEYPAEKKRVYARCGETVRWEVPGESAVVLRLARAKK